MTEGTDEGAETVVADDAGQATADASAGIIRSQALTPRESMKLIEGLLGSL